MTQRYNSSIKKEIKLVDVDDPDESLWDEYTIYLVPTIIVFKSSVQLFRRDAKPGVGLLVEDLEEAIQSISSEL